VHAILRDSGHLFNMSSLAAYGKKQRSGNKARLKAEKAGDAIVVADIQPAN